MLVLGDTGVVEGGDPVFVFEGMQSLADLVFDEIEYRVTAGFLVAGVDESVEGERIVLGSGDLFFDEGAENARLDGVEHHSSSL